MADLKITQLSSASIATGSNVLPIVQGGVTDQITVTNLGQGIFNLNLPLTSSAVLAAGLKYPTTDGTFESQVLQTNASGILSFGNVQTSYDTIYNGEITTLVKGTPVFISGSNGANPKVYRANASFSSKMPAIYIVSEDITTGTTGRGITLGQIDGIDLTGYTPGTAVYVAEGGGWTSTRPTGSTSIVQFLGLVTKEGSGGKGLILNPGPVVLPNLQSGSAWVGNSSNFPTAVATSSFVVTNATSASLATTSSYATNHAVITSSYVCDGILNANQTFATGSDAVIAFVDYNDPNNWLTSNQFKPTIAGYYNISFGVWVDNPGVSSNQVNAQMRKNNSTMIISQLPLNNGTGISLGGSRVLQMNGTTDYIDWTIFQGSGSSANGTLLQGSANGQGTWFSAFLITQ